MNAIEVRNAVKEYESHVVLDHLNMSVKHGTIYTLMGSSGCGKTTLLSCIVGSNSINSGSIKVLNQPVGRHLTKIGFMPQDLSLVEEFTVKELLNFFGAVYGLTTTARVERIKFLINLLDLSDNDSLIRNFSGGQKRRVSLAICLVHEPELLILDEPTVGLDPLLRLEIWSFLKQITFSSQTTVLITTHYIEEAKQANCVGLLRKGVIIAEDSPETLLSKFNASSLEGVFLKLCELQNLNKDKAEKPTIKELIEREVTSQEIANQTSKCCKIKALMIKNFIQTIRRPTSFGFLLLTPFICLMSFYLTIGGDPMGLKIGIVNNEIKNFSECSDPILKMTTIVDDTCRVSKISCRFINGINESIASKKFYSTFREAYEDVKSGSLIGLIEFSQHFTSSMKPLSEIESLLENYTSQGEIQVYLDQSDRQISFFMKQKLYEVFQTFIEDLMQACGKSRRIGSSPIKVTALYGSLRDEVRKSMVPGIIITMVFFLASMITSTAFISDRLDGIWDRVLLAGVKPSDILISHIVSSSLIMIIQILEFYFITTHIYGLDSKGEILTVFALILLVGFSAILYGLAASILAKNFTTSTFLSTLIFYPLVIMCGIFWPLEAIPWYFRYIAYCLPFTLPTVALRNILYKGFTFADFTVQIGFLIVGSWILLSLIICYVGLKSKKFCKS